jgi:HK97 family phage prohead protease
MNKTKTPAVQPTQFYSADAHLKIRAESDLPPGIAGRITGVALTYEVLDTYRTIFARGSAKRSIDNKVAARKVPLLMDHNKTTGAHVGVVASMAEIGDAVMMTAEIFDTPDGRAALEYVKAVIAAGASTGLSIGFVPRRSEMVQTADGMAERFTEIELREVSITPMPAVPGADVTGARADGVAIDEGSEVGEDGPAEAVPATTTETVTSRSEAELLAIAARVALDAMTADDRNALLEQYRTNPATIPTRTVSTTTAATVRPTVRQTTMDERLKAVRSTFLSPYGA